jgi:hypothetical protein
MNFFSLPREPPLLNDKFTSTLPSPNHMKHAVSLRRFHNEHFKSPETQVPLDAPTEFLQVFSQKISRTTLSRSQIHPNQLAIA